MEFCNFIKEIDFFGKLPEFYLKGKPKLATWFGRIFTYIFIIFYIVIFCYKLIRMYQRLDITFYDSYSNIDEIPEIKVTHDNFSIVFAVFNENGEPFIDRSIYYPKAYFIDEDRQYDINIEICNPNKINNKYKQYLKDYTINNFYCLTDIDYTFKPYINSLTVKIYPCKNDSDNDIVCDTNANIDESLHNNIFMVYFEDIILTPLNYDEPIKERINALSSDIYKNLGQYLYTELQLVRIETSTNIIGFDFLTEPRVEEFIKFDKELSYAYPYNSDDINNDYFVAFEVQLNDKILLEKRQYIQLIDVLGEIGGFMEMIHSLFSLICSLIVDMLYERKITNNLFSFNIDKKLILIKQCKNSEIVFNNDESDKNTENEKIIEKKFDLTEKKIKKEKIDKITSEMLNNTNTTIINKSDKDNSQIITKITLKDILSSICSCGKRNRKKIYKILINESMNIIMNKLDIINIFRNICSIEHSNNDLNLNKNPDTINMSKKCVSDLSEIIEQHHSIKKELH